MNPSGVDKDGYTGWTDETATKRVDQLFLARDVQVVGMDVLYHTRPECKACQLAVRSDMCKACSASTNLPRWVNG